MYVSSTLVFGLIDAVAIRDLSMIHAGELSAVVLALTRVLSRNVFGKRAAHPKSYSKSDKLQHDNATTVVNMNSIL